MTPTRRNHSVELLSATSVLLAACVAAAATMYGAEREAASFVIRQTARISVVLFSLAFAASSAAILLRNQFSLWAMRNRRYLGIAFALSHFTHLAAIVVLDRLDPSFEVDLVTLIFGGGAYVFIGIMAATSNDRSIRWMGRQRWQQIHKVGAYYIWFLFAISYVPRALQSPIYIPPVLLLAVALGLRITAYRRTSRAVTSSPEMTTAT